MTAHPAAGDVIAAYAAVARPIQREYLRADSCIESTRQTITVLRYFGVRAVPAPVQVVAFNAAAAAYLDRPGEALSEASRDSASRAPSVVVPWTVGVGIPAEETNVLGPRTPQEGPRWIGHLCAAIPSRNLLVDVALDQAERPAYGLLIGPRVESYPPQWWGFPGAEPVTYRLENGCALMVTHRPGNTTFRTSPAWSGRGALHREMTASTITAMRGWLTHPPVHKETQT